MKSEFKVKFLQHINEKNQDKGFTLIELLVVVIIIGILAAIALPSLLSQTSKAKQAEARQNVGAMNRAQQAYYLEKGAFSTSIVDLGVGIKEQTANFSYTISTSTSPVSNKASGLSTSLKSYVGGVGTITTSGATTEALTVAILCESNNPGQALADVTNVNSCPTNFKNLGN